MKRAVMLLLALVSGTATLVAENPQQAFVKVWQGRTVTVKTTLYSLLYNERGRLGTSRSGLREGLVVVTPTQGTYFRFDGRQGRGDVTQYDLQRVVGAVNTAYQADTLDVRSYRRLEAVTINRYDPGTELVVRSVRLGPDEVRFDFAVPGDRELVTGIRIKWPVPLSISFSERPLVEGLMRQFVEVTQPLTGPDLDSANLSRPASTRTPSGGTR